MPREVKKIPERKYSFPGLEGSIGVCKADQKWLVQGRGGLQAQG